jgi:hypothetical protein
MAMDFIATWIYLDNPAESSEYPQVGKKSHQRDFQQIYWRCVTVFYTYSTTHNAGKKHLLFSNSGWEAIPQVDGFNVAAYLKSLDVELVRLPLTFQTPPGYYGKWRNQFYLFDILKFFETTYNPSDTLVVLDSDCLVLQPLETLFQDIHRHGLMVLPLAYTDDQSINGISRQEMKTVFEALDGVSPEFPPTYYGGEIFAATGSTVGIINAIVPGLWEYMLLQHENKAAKFNEEAHFLSYCYYKIGQFGILTNTIKRIWTAPLHTTAAAADLNLPIWHLPSEKTGGFILLFRAIKQGRGILDARQLGQLTGVTGRVAYAGVKHWFRYTGLYKFLKK